MKTLHFPTGGLDRKLSYRQQRPYTTPDCLNVRPTDTIEGRERGGSRPGLSKAYKLQLEGGVPVRMMNSVASVRDDGFRYWIDTFSSDVLGSLWTTAAWVGDGSEIGILPDDFSDIVYSPSEAGIIRAAVSNFDYEQPYSVEMFILPWEDEHHGEYRLYARMNNTTPNALIDGVIANLVLTGTGGVFSGTLETYAAEVLINEYEFVVTGSPIGDYEGGWFSMVIDGDDISVYWRDELLLDSVDVSADLDDEPENHYRVGCGAKVTALDYGGLCLIDMFQMRYYQTVVSESYRNRLIAVAGGRIYQEDEVERTMVETASALTLNPDVSLQSAEFEQELYIADFSNKPVIEETGSSLDANGLILSDAGIDATEAAEIGSNKLDLVVVLLNGQGGAADKEGNYKIASAVTGAIALSSSATDGTVGTCSIRVERAPKIYNPVTDTIRIWEATAGIIPTTCSLICRVFGCLMLAGDRLDPHNWYLSRVLDPLDFDYFSDPDDPMRAVAGNNCEAGKIGEPITALISSSDDYCLMSGTDSLYVMRGHPLYSGSIDKLSDISGIVSSNAYAYGPNGEIIFLSKDGLYVMGSGTEASPERFSRERLPRELLNVDTSLYQVSMAYDIRDQGFHLYVTPINSQGDLYQKHWWIDWNSKSFWPVKLYEEHEPFSCFRYNNARTDDSRVLLGCRDGYIRSYKSTNKNDDGNLIESYVLIGPIPLGSDIGGKGIVNELRGVLGEKSRPVEWGVIVGDTHQQVSYRDPVESGTWIHGSNRIVRPKRSGVSFSVKISSNYSWAMEGIGANWYSTGEQK